MRSGVSRDRVAPPAKRGSGAGPAGVARPAVGSPSSLAGAQAEREADRTARAVMRSQPSGAAALPPPAAALTGPEGGEGRPLSEATRAFFEPRLGRDLSHVRVHTDAGAARAARALNAAAYTRGSDIVFGDGHGTPESRAGRMLLAHELAHVVQQSGLPGSDVIQRQPLPFAPPKRFKEIWPEFEQARGGFELTRATALARELAVAPYDQDDLLNHGISLVAWLQRNGAPALAAHVLDELGSVWMTRFVSRGAALPSLGELGWGGSDPSVLITLGREAARAGRHDLAFSLLGVANQLLSYYALRESDQRMKALEAESAEDAAAAEGGGYDPAKQESRSGSSFVRMIARSKPYGDLRSLYDQMREIYGVYATLEREALAAGDAKGAADARTRSTELHRTIKETYTWGDTQATGSISEVVHNPVEIAEVSYTETPKGPGLTLHGANSAETTLTPLPGLPSPKEVGNNVQVQNLGALQTALMEQSDFQAEIGRQPEIRQAFGDEPVDLHDTAKRQQVWQIMYGVFQRSGAGALGALMALIGRYLGAFTTHTMYNVRDWGTSYLDSQMPTDLAGRAEQDCGVYALTVAWDVYQTVKRGSPKLMVTFDLVTMLEHVALIVTDKSTGEFYVVNNDQVSPPQRGNPLAPVAKLYAGVRGLPYTVGLAVPVSLGSTAQAPKAFHDEAWTRYLASADWGLRVDIPSDLVPLEKTDPAAFAHTMAALRQERYERYYREQRRFDQGAAALDPLVDGAAAHAGDAASLAAALDPLVDRAGALAVLFYNLGPAAGVAVGSAKSQKILPPNAEGLFTMGPGGRTVHPIARVALGVLRLQALGGTPTPKAIALTQFCGKIPGLKRLLDAYQAAGATGPF